MRLLGIDETATKQLAGRIAARLSTGDVLLLSGPLGAGKTSFARALIRCLTSEPALVVPSPTFTLVQTYETARGMVWHYDLWRLADHEGLTELGWDEAQSGIVLVEWPDRLGPLKPAKPIEISITPAGETRDIMIKGLEDDQHDA